jgi:hypothetical protein
MNHDYTHCADYKKSTCPKSCFRAQLVEDLNRIHYSLPVSYANLKGTSYCPKWPEKKED